MDRQEEKQYFNYLKSISWKGKAYFKYILYPILDRHLNGKTVDIGCGLGYIFDQRGDSIGIDINPFCVEYCKKKGFESYYFKNPEYDFPNDTFDSVLFNNVIEHIEDPNKILDEIKRILKPKGNLIIGVPGIKGFKKDPDHKVYYDERKLEQVLGEKKFKKEYFFHTPFESKFLNKNLNAYSIFGVFKKY